MSFNTRYSYFKDFLRYYIVLVFFATSSSSATKKMCTSLIGCFPIWQPGMRTRASSCNHTTADGRGRGMRKWAWQSAGHARVCGGYLMFHIKKKKGKKRHFLYPHVLGLRHGSAVVAYIG